MTNQMLSPARSRRQRRASARDAGPAEFLDAMPELAAAADCAPSPIDVKPWRLRARSGAVDLLADASFRTEDPELQRQIVIACGASLFNLRLAVTHLGQRPITTPLPVPAEPDLLARIEPGGPAPASEANANLYLALTSRHTQREPFAQPFVAPELLDQLTAGVGVEGACLVPVTTDPRRRALDALMTDAAGHPGTLERMRSRPRAAWAGGGSGAVVLLATAGDTTRDWLNAGQALQRLLLTATTLWLDARFHTHVLEVPELREQVRRSLCPGWFPQVVLELGQSQLVRTGSTRQA